jgi:hypothetical protein
MPQQVCNSAQLTCSFGSTPSALVVLPTNKVFSSSQPAANIMDHKPMVNVTPFGMCSSLANPAVAAATAAAQGSLTPMPCVPNTPSPWMPGVPSVLIGNQPAVDNMCTLACAWAGVITVVAAGQGSHFIP